MTVKKQARLKNTAIFGLSRINYPCRGTLFQLDQLCQFKNCSIFWDRRCPLLWKLYPFFDSEIYFRKFYVEPVSGAFSQKSALFFNSREMSANLNCLKQTHIRTMLCCAFVEGVTFAPNAPPFIFT